MNYKRYFYGGGLVICLLFSKIVLAQALVINLYEVNGQGIGVNNVQINNILINTPIIDPITGLLKEVPLPFSYNFRACQSDPVDPNTLYLEPLLSGLEPPCYMSPLDFSDARVVGGMNDINGFSITNRVQLINVRSYADELVMDSLNPNYSAITTDYNIILELNLEKLRLEQVDKYPSPPPSFPIKIIVLWEESRRLDFDAHLTGPAPELPGSYYNEPGRFHVYFGNKSYESIYLDADFFSNSQPETIEISPPPGQDKLKPGIYRYTVHHFQGNGNFVEAQVKVHLWIGGIEQVFEPQFPLGKDENWNSSMFGWKVLELIVSENGMIQVQPYQDYALSNPPEVRRKHQLN